MRHDYAAAKTTLCSNVSTAPRISRFASTIGSLENIIVDSWLQQAGARGPLRSMKQRTFYETLALELVDNDLILSASARA
jgi:hypothetical protein